MQGCGLDTQGGISVVYFCEHDNEPSNSVAGHPSGRVAMLWLGVRSLAGSAGSNLAGGMDVSLYGVLCFVR